MQLRDDKTYITAPDMWGFFGGEICRDETELDAANRELKEELSITANLVKLASATEVQGFPDTCSTAFTFSTESISGELKQNEGKDMKFVSIKEIECGRIWSNKIKQYKFVVPTTYIPEYAKLAIKYWGVQI